MQAHVYYKCCHIYNMFPLYLDRFLISHTCTELIEHICWIPTCAKHCVRCFGEPGWVRQALSYGAERVLGERRLQNKLYAHLSRRLYHQKVVSNVLKGLQEREYLQSRKSEKASWWRWHFELKVDLRDNRC